MTHRHAWRMNANLGRPNEQCGCGAYRQHRHVWERCSAYCARCGLSREDVANGVTALPRMVGRYRADDVRPYRVARP